MLRSWLAHPLTRRLDIDDPRTTHLRRQILREKGFLQHVYRVWYTSSAAELPHGQGGVLELGSGAGFLSDLVPNLITSEVFWRPGVRVALDGMQMPFATGAVSLSCRTFQFLTQEWRLDKDWFHVMPDNDLA